MERPAKVAVPGARRLPPSLTSLSPALSPSPTGCEHGRRMHEAASMTSTTRRGPPLAAGTKPQGWREWLQQRRAMNTVVPRPEPEPYDATNQRV